MSRSCTKRVPGSTRPQRGETDRSLGALAGSCVIGVQRRPIALTSRLDLAGGTHPEGRPAPATVKTRARWDYALLPSRRRKGARGPTRGATPRQQPVECRGLQEPSVTNWRSCAGVGALYLVRGAAATRSRRTIRFAPSGDRVPSGRRPTPGRPIDASPRSSHAGKEVRPVTSQDSFVHLPQRGHVAATLPCFVCGVSSGGPGRVGRTSR